MADTTKLQLPLLAAAQAQKHVTHNEAILRLDGLVQMQAKSYTTSAEPGSPVDGDLYLLPPGKTGTNWGGAANHAVAHYYDGVWHFYTPRPGWICFVVDSATLLWFNAASWAAVVSPSAAAIADGTAAAPGLAFSADTNTGLFRPASDILAISAGGTERGRWSSQGITTIDGSAASPAHGFSADTDNGLYRIGTNNPGLAAGGSLVHNWSPAGNLQPLQPCFMAYLNSTTANCTGDGTFQTVNGLTEVFDQGSNFDPSTGVFTAPLTGRYLICVQVTFKDLAAGHTPVELQIDASNRIAYAFYQANSQSGGFQRLPFATIIDMDAGDTVSAKARASGGAKVVDFYSGGTGAVDTGISGCLLS